MYAAQEKSWRIESLKSEITRLSRILRDARVTQDERMIAESELAFTVQEFQEAAR